MTKKLTLICLCAMNFPVQAITNCTTQSQIPELECDTLLSFFKSTGRAGWYDVFLNGWDVTQTPCTWTGITCQDGHVTEINRANNGLEGTLPDLINLTQLKTLDVSDNLLTGTIDYQKLPLNLVVFNFQGTDLVAEFETTDVTATPSTVDEQITITETGETDTSSTTHDESTPIITTLPSSQTTTPSTTVSPSVIVDSSTNQEVQEEGHTTDSAAVLEGSTEEDGDDGLPLLGQDRMGQEVNIATGELFNSDSQFRGGISTDGQVTFSKQNINLVSGQSVHIKGHIQFIEQHIGQKADLLVLGIYDVGNQLLYYTNTAENNVTNIEMGDFGIPVFTENKVFKRGIILGDSVEMNLYEGMLSTGKLDVYFGYRLENQPNSIFYTPNSIQMIIE